MSFIKKNLGALAFTLFMAVFPIISFAQLSDEGKIINPIRYDTINKFIKALLTGVLKIGIPVVALAIIYSGFLFVFARGNSEKLTKARESLLYTLIGAAILLGSWAIAELISATVLELSTLPINLI